MMILQIWLQVREGDVARGGEGGGNGPKMAANESQGWI